MANPFPFVSGAVLTAAQLNGIGEKTNFTPGFSNFTLGNGTVNVGIHVRVQNLVFCQVKVTLGSTSAVTGNIFFGVPVATTDSEQGPVGVCNFGDTSAGIFEIGNVVMSSGQLQLLPTLASGTYARQTNTSATVPFTWATGDTFTCSATYRTTL